MGEFKKKYNMVVVVLLIGVLLLGGIMYYMLIASKKPGKLKNMRRIICTMGNVKNGIYDESIIKWCDLPISSRLDQGGVPDNMLDITHPSVVLLPKPWNGYNVWLAATPYPQIIGNDAQIYENTSIFHACTHNSAFPSKFIAIKHNPIIYGEEAKYNSDPELFMDDDSTMYVITRKCIGPDYFARIVLQQSRDGENWSYPVTLLKTDRLSMCPCLIKVGERYRIYMFNTHFDERYSKYIGGIITDNIEIWESESLSHPDFHLVKYVKWNNLSNVWHGDVVFYHHKYYMLYCGTNYNYKILYGMGRVIDTFKYLWLAVSDDGYNFKAFPKPLLKRAGIYRPTFVIENDIMTIYFATENSYIGKDSKRYPGGDRIGLFSISLNDLIKKENNK